MCVTHPWEHAVLNFRVHAFAVNDWSTPTFMQQNFRGCNSLKLLSTDLNIITILFKKYNIYINAIISYLYHRLFLSFNYKGSFNFHAAKSRALLKLTRVPAHRKSRRMLCNQFGCALCKFLYCNGLELKYFCKNI